MIWIHHDSPSGCLVSWTCCEATVATGIYDVRHGRFAVDPFTTWFWRAHDGILIWIGTYSKQVDAQNAAERDGGRGISQRIRGGWA